MVTTNAPNLENFAFLTEMVLNPLLRLPSPLKLEVEQQLKELLHLIKDTRPPRFLIVGRRGAGKSALINAIFDAKVKDTGAVKPKTGKTEWQEYERGGEKIEILDTRGFHEGEKPEEEDNASTPLESIIKAARASCPDAVLFLCKATEVNAAIQSDIDILEQILRGIKEVYHAQLPIIGVVTQCDQLEPPDILKLPTEDEDKNNNINEAVNAFETRLLERRHLPYHLVKVIPTAAYVRFRQDGTKDSDRDYRWNIDYLADLIVKELPKDAKFGFARLARVRKYQREMAATIVHLCATACGCFGANPIPGADLPVIGSIQTIMVMAIGYISGRRLSLEIAGDFLATVGVGVSTDAGLAAIAMSLLKLLPVAGPVISGVGAATATKGIGDSAIAFFIK